MGENPSSFSKKENCPDDYLVLHIGIKVIGVCPNHPVESVSWKNVQSFINTVNLIADPSKKTKLYRLPTEAEWELAARGRDPKTGEVTTSAYSFGEYDENTLKEHAIFNASQTARVGSKKLNPNGLYDVHGNVYNWVLDLYLKDDHTQAVSQEDGDKVQETLVQDGDPSRVLRGGSWGSTARHLRSAARSDDGPLGSNAYVGFRLRKAQ